MNRRRCPFSTTLSSQRHLSALRVSALSFPDLFLYPLNFERSTINLRPYLDAASSLSPLDRTSHRPPGLSNRPGHQLLPRQSLHTPRQQLHLPSPRGRPRLHQQPPAPHTPRHRRRQRSRYHRPHRPRSRRSPRHRRRSPPRSRRRIRAERRARVRVRVSQGELSRDSRRTLRRLHVQCADHARSRATKRVPLILGYHSRPHQKTLMTATSLPVGARFIVPSLLSPRARLVGARHAVPVLLRPFRLSTVDCRLSSAPCPLTPPPHQHTIAPVQGCNTIQFDRWG